MSPGTTLALYDAERHRWTPQCPYGDVCTGCDAAGRCSRASECTSFDTGRPATWLPRIKRLRKRLREIERDV